MLSHAPFNNASAWKTQPPPVILKTRQGKKPTNQTNQAQINPQNAGSPSHCISSKAESTGVMGGRQGAEPQRGTSAALTLPVPPPPAGISRLEPSLSSPSSHSCPGPRQLHQPPLLSPTRFGPEIIYYADGVRGDKGRAKEEEEEEGAANGVRTEPVLSLPRASPRPVPAARKQPPPPIPPPPRLRAGQRTMGIGAPGESAKDRGRRDTFSPSPAATQLSRPSDGASAPHSAAGAQLCPPPYSAGHSPVPQRAPHTALDGHRRDPPGGMGRILQAGERSGRAQANGRASGGRRWAAAGRGCAGRFGGRCWCWCRCRCEGRAGPGRDRGGGARQLRGCKQSVT